MYFLRRRHGRKSQSDQSRDQRRDKPPVVTQAPATQAPAMPIYAEAEENTAPRPVVITKTRRARTELPESDDSKPAGTFRAGTLHIARVNETGASHG